MAELKKAVRKGPQAGATGAASRKKQEAPGAEAALNRSADLRPTDFLALQRTAGNAATTRVVQRAMPSGTAPSELFADRPADHPEWARFEGLMRSSGFPSDITEIAWQLLMGGLSEQGRLNREAAASGLDDAGRRAHRSSNTWYREFIALLGDSLRAGKPSMALWSGGIDVSRYAEGKGHTPLEATRLGRICDQLELNSNWKLQAPLWNVLSTAFVQRATVPVHIYLRAYDPESVLMAQEIPQLRIVQRLNPDVRLVWHPLYTTPDNKIKEIAADFTLVEDAPYTSRDKCVGVMYQYLLRFHDTANAKSSRAYDEMNKLLAKNVVSKKA
ncbi:hypothetical protein [Actinomadura gamaensis]|uniref:Uncharacterized protein n=1 Tax=Actinomadura gamaensis TaxID=1763541 RepID=A0ABV9U181_9ACTN